MNSITPDPSAVWNALLECLPAAVFVCDAKLKLMAANTRFAHLSGVAEVDECVGQSLEQILPEGIVTDLLRVLRERDSSQPAAEFEIMATNESGSQSFFEISVRRHETSERMPEFLVGSIVDVSSKRMMESVLQEEHSLLRTVIDILPAFIYAKDEDSKFIMANEVLAGYMGCKSSEELIGKSDFDFFPHKYAMKYFCDEQEVIATGRPKVNVQESSAFQDSGSMIWLNTNKVPLRDSSGKIVGVVGTGMDISHQKRINDELHELQEIVNHSSSCAFLLQSTGSWDVSFCSKTVSLFGYEQEDFLTRHLRFLQIVHPDDVEGLRTATLAAFASGEKHVSMDYRIRRKGGGYCWVEDQIYLRETRENGSFLFQSLITDVSKRYDMQRERDQMEMQLRQAQKLEAVGQLAAGIAHEINTPIQFISDNLQFLSESASEFMSFYQGVMSELNSSIPEHQKLESKFKELAEKLDLGFLMEEVPLAISQSLEGAHRVRDIVQAMKDFSHPGSGEISHEDVNQAIQSTITVARNEWKYVSDVETELDADLGMVPVDIGPFKQSILNLIVNAAHAIEDRVKAGDFEKGKIVIRTRRTQDHAVIEVEDTGSGMNPKVAERVFDPFFTTKAVGKGTGQGLSMTYDIVVRKHRGKLHFRTREGEGTTFVVELPLGSGVEHAPVI
ncbi:MAG: PAS domain S-box protein [Puniceicoccaceae bacterium]